MIRASGESFWFSVYLRTESAPPGHYLRTESAPPGHYLRTESAPPGRYLSHASLERRLRLLSNHLSPGAVTDQRDGPR